MEKPLIIAGPCSAETLAQLLQTAQQLSQTNLVDIFRAGIWKPRTRPNQFEGVGEEGLKWMLEVKHTYGFKTATEIATPKQLELCLKYNIDCFWIGARTTVNPFLIEELACAAQGIDHEFYIKNPVNPDLALWLGAYERLNRKNVKIAGMIHRGFSLAEQSGFRNTPVWKIVQALQTELPFVPVLLDPSHMAGNAQLIDVCMNQAQQISYQGYMIEVHHNPTHAWSDAAQQITPQQFEKILTSQYLGKSVSCS